jgi:hypothetical protein
MQDDADPLLLALKRLGIRADVVPDELADKIRGLEDEVNTLRLRTLKENLDASGSTVRIAELEKRLAAAPHDPLCPCASCDKTCETCACVAPCWKSNMPTRRRQR